METFNMSGRGVAITGAAGHLGSAMTAAVIEAGGTVAAIGRNPDSLAALADRVGTSELLQVPADVAEEGLVEHVAAELLDAGAPMRGWVNNAYGGGAKQLGGLDRESVTSTLEAGLTDAMVLADHAAPLLANAGGGSIVNVASMYGVVSPQPAAYENAPKLHNPPAYGAAKAGLIQFTRYAATHWAGMGVRVNALVPGAFPSDEVQQDEAFAAELTSRVPLGRLGEPQELGGALVFLLAEASSYMTGQQLVIDGGWTAW